MVLSFKCIGCGILFKRDWYPSSRQTKYCTVLCSRTQLKKTQKAPWLTKINLLRNKTQGKKYAKRIREAQPNLGRGNGKTYAKLHGRHEHRVVMEKLLGRKLLFTDVIHHKDGNKRNNDPKNLLLTTRQKHMSFHKKKK